MTKILWYGWPSLEDIEGSPDCSGLFRGYIAFNVGQKDTELANLRQPRILSLAVCIP
jgi:hypothetical protein